MLTIYKVDNKVKSKIRGFWLEAGKVYKDNIHPEAVKHNRLQSITKELFKSGELAVFYKSTHQGFIISRNGKRTSLRNRLSYQRNRLLPSEIKALIYKYGGLTVYANKPGTFILEVFYNDEPMSLYHYSDAQFKTLEPGLFGKNYYTMNDARACSIPRAFCYLKPEPLEYRFKGSKILYNISVERHELYNLQVDPQGLKTKYAGNIAGLLSYIKEYYQGCVYQAGGLDIAILFYNTPAKEAK